MIVIQLINIAIVYIITKKRNFVSGCTKVKFEVKNDASTYSKECEFLTVSVEEELYIDGSSIRNIDFVLDLSNLKKLSLLSNAFL